MHRLHVAHARNLKGVRYLLQPVPPVLLILHFPRRKSISEISTCALRILIPTIARMEPWVDSSTVSTSSPLVSFTSGGSLRWMSPELLDPKRFNLPDPLPTKESHRFAVGMDIYEVRGCQLLVLLKLAIVVLLCDRCCVGTSRIMVSGIGGRSAERY